MVALVSASGWAGPQADAETDLGASLAGPGHPGCVSRSGRSEAVAVAVGVGGQ